MLPKEHQTVRIRCPNKWLLRNCCMFQRAKKGCFACCCCLILLSVVERSPRRLVFYEALPSSPPPPKHDCSHPYSLATSNRKRAKPSPPCTYFRRSIERQQAAQVNGWFVTAAHVNVSTRKRLCELLPNAAIGRSNGRVPAVSLLLHSSALVTPSPQHDCSRPFPRT